MGEEPLDWTGRADAEANLGLALLMLDEDEKGLKRLRGAAARRCLENELVHAAAASRHDQAAALRARLDGLGRR